MSGIRVLQLGSPAGLYGAERWILALVRHLDRNAVHSIVGVIADDPRQDAPLCSEARKLGVDAQSIEAHGRFNWRAVQRLRRFLLDNRIDILHTHFYKTDLIGLLATAGTKCKLVTTPHGWSSAAGLALRAYETLDRWIFRFFDAVVPLSDKIFEELRPSLASSGRLRVIHNGVDLEEIDASQVTTGELKTWRDAGCFVVGYIGQLITRKGLTVLLTAFARLPQRQKKLVLVGDGPQREELVALAASLGIAEQVAFLGYRVDRLELLKAFDVFVLPSRLEGIPRCLMESMAAGVPVVSSDIPGSTDLVEHGRTGLLFAMDDDAQLESCLQRCLDTTLRQTLAENGRQFVLDNYSAASMARKYQVLYAELMAADRSGPT